MLENGPYVTYFNEKLNGTTFNYPIYDKKLYACEDLRDLETLSLA